MHIKSTMLAFDNFLTVGFVTLVWVNKGEKSVKEKLKILYFCMKAGTTQEMSTKVI